MTKINNIQPMEFNFFEAPNKLFAFSTDMTMVIIAKLEDITFENNFCIDATTFQMLKKLKTDQTISFNNNSIIIKSKQGNFKSQLIDKKKPSIVLDNFLFQDVYKLDTLKKAMKFASSNKVRPFLTGVLFDELGGIVGTDTFRIYSNNLKNGLKYSVPTRFIELLNEEKCLLKFNKNKVLYEGDYEIISSLYDGEIPDLTKLINKIKVSNNHKITLNKCEEMYFHVSNIIEFNLKLDNLELNYKNDVNEFKVRIPIMSSIEANYIFNREQFMKVFELFETIDLYLSDNPLTPIYARNGEEELVLMPMRKNE